MQADDLAARREGRSCGTDWFAVAAVVVGITAFASAQGLTYPLISLQLAHRGVGEGMIGLNAAAFMAGLGASNLVMARLTGALRAAPLIALSLLGAAATLMGFAVTDHLAAWFVLRFGLGFCVNTIYVVGEAWLNAASADATRGRVISLYGMGLALGFALGPLGAALAGPQSALGFAVASAALVVVATVFALAARRARAEPEPMPRGTLFAFASRVPRLVALVAIFGMMDATVLAILPVALEADGMGAAAAAVVLTVVHLGMIAAQPVFGVALDRFDRWHVASLSLALTAAAFVGLALAPATSWAVWPLAMLAGGASFGVYTTALSLLGGQHRGGELVTGSALFSLAYAVGGVVAPPVAGASMALSNGAPSLAMALAALAGVVLVAARRRSPGA